MVNIRDPKPNIRPHQPTGVARVIDAPKQSLGGSLTLTGGGPADGHEVVGLTGIPRAEEFLVELRAVVESQLKWIDDEIAQLRTARTGALSVTPVATPTPTAPGVIPT